MNMEAILSKMMLEDKIALCSGADFWHTKQMPGGERHDDERRFHGLRKQESSADMLGVNRSVPATCFPTVVSTACS